MPISGRPKPEILFLPGAVRWTPMPKERYGDSLSGRGSNEYPVFELRGGHFTTELSCLWSYTETSGIYLLDKETFINIWNSLHSSSK